MTGLFSNRLNPFVTPPSLAKRPDCHGVAADKLTNDCSKLHMLLWQAIAAVCYMRQILGLTAPRGPVSEHTFQAPLQVGADQGAFLFHAACKHRVVTFLVAVLIVNVFSRAAGD